MSVGVDSVVRKKENESAVIESFGTLSWGDRGCQILGLELHFQNSDKCIKMLIVIFKNYVCVHVCRCPYNPEEGVRPPAQCLRVLAEDLNSIPSTSVRQLTIGCNSSSRGYDTSGLCGHLNSHAHTYTQAHSLK